MDNVVSVREVTDLPENLNDPLEYLRAAASESVRVKEQFFEKNAETLLSVAKGLGQAFQNGGKVLIAGNGGSASDSQHFAGELVGRLLIERNPKAALALTTDTSVITAIANDYSYEEIFSKQIEAFGEKGDFFFAISTSGNSPNILRAVEVAKDKGMRVVALTGKDGGKLSQVADDVLSAELGRNSPRIQETHIACIHILIELIDGFFLGNSDKGN